jgi:hypothetical protein
MAVSQPAIKTLGGVVRLRLANEGIVVLDYGGEMGVNFTAALNTTYDVDLTGGARLVTPATGFIAGDKFQLIDSRWLCGPYVPITIKFTLVPGYLFCGQLRDCDLVEPGASSIFEYRSATIGFVRI